MDLIKAKELLGLMTLAPTEKELKDAARKARSLHHPDKGGNAEKFKLIEDALALFRKVYAGVQHIDLSLADAYTGSTVLLTTGVTIDIPPGVVNGQLLDTPYGSFRINVTVPKNVSVLWAKNPLMRDGQIDNSGLVKFKVHVPWLSLAIGDTIEIVSPFGEAHTVRIPAGILESGNEHVHARIVRGGYWSDNYAVRRGDIHISFVPVIPALSKMSTADLQHFICEASAELSRRGV